MTMLEIEVIQEAGARRAHRGLHRQALAETWVHSDLIAQMLWREVMGRYQGTALGIVWSLISPPDDAGRVHVCIWLCVSGCASGGRWVGGLCFVLFLRE